MQRLPRIFCLALTAFVVTLAYATPVPNNTRNPKTFLGPTVRLGATKAVGDMGAVSVAGEAGLRNYRLSTTLGWQPDYNQRVKITGELLRQNITYSFFDGTDKPWVNQGAIGADYQYLFHDKLPYDTRLDLSGYFSHAPSQTIGTSSGSYLSGGDTIEYVINKRIAGSNAIGASPALEVVFPTGTTAGLGLNYDNVRYDTVYRQRSADAKGFGGTAKLGQALSPDVSLNLSAAVRQPFNNYQADLTWGNVPYNGTWIFKLFGAYTIGKNSLPTTYNFGLGADYLIDVHNEKPNFPASQPMGNYKDRVAYKDILPPMEWNDPDEGDKEFLSWVAVPAVYMPQVLAVAEQSRCTPVALLGEIPDFDILNPVEFYDVSPYFSGDNLTYTISTIPPADGSVSISNSGVITFTVNGGIDADFTVTATNACGSASSTFHAAD